MSSNTRSHYNGVMPDPEIVEQSVKSMLVAGRGVRPGWSATAYRGSSHRSFDGWGGRAYVKLNAAPVLRRELARRTWKHETVAIGPSADPYQPLEERYRLTRGMLEALCDRQTPAELATRSILVLRDLDVLQALAGAAGVRVSIGLSTIDERIANDIEPAAAPPRERLRAVRRLAEAGIAVDVVLAPVLPRITDTERNIEDVVRAAADAGARTVWHDASRAHDVTREAFFGYLRTRRPELIAQYADAYKGTNAPRTVAAEIEARVSRSLVDAVQRFVAPRIACRAPLQLSLI